MKISIIIPIYNEILTIGTLLKKVAQTDLNEIEKEIILVDDHSSDGTIKYLNKLETDIKNGALTYTYDKNKNLFIFIYKSKHEGKGSALKTGFKSSTGDVIIIQDSDMEYSSDFYPNLLDEVLHKNTKIVYGSRYQTESNYQPISIFYLWANKIITFLFNLTSNQKITDLMTGFKVFRREILDNIKLEENGFGFEPEFTIKADRMGYKISEIPISYKGRTKDEGKKIKFKDFILILFCLVKYKTNLQSNPSL